jgi:hypothetical protein
MSSLSNFCPEGYVPAQAAIERAARTWFAETFAEIETPAADNSVITDEPKGGVAELARALSHLPIPDALSRAYADIAIETVHRLRNLLHQGQLLKAYYFGGLFGPSGRQTLAPEFWAPPEADGVLESGIYFPFGRPGSWYEQRQSYPLFLLKADLDALLSEQHNSKKSFPAAKQPELVAALLSLSDLPTREAQRKALRELPEFRPYHITDSMFRKAAKQAPRPLGRPPKAAPRLNRCSNRGENSGRIC